MKCSCCCCLGKRGTLLCMLGKLLYQNLCGALLLFGDSLTLHYELLFAVVVYTGSTPVMLHTVWYVLYLSLYLNPFSVTSLVTHKTSKQTNKQIVHYGYSTRTTFTRKTTTKCNSQYLETKYGVSLFFKTFI